MPSKKKLEFNNIVKEFGFPTSIERIKNTYKMECFQEGSDMYWEAEEFEREFKEEIERQDSDANKKYTKDLQVDYYYRFQNIFLKHQKLFDSEMYLLQMSILMEKDNSTRETIRAILKSRGISNITNEFVDALFVKDNNAISNLMQMLSVTGMNIKEAMKVAKFFESRNLSTPNVYLPVSNKRDLKSLMNTIRNRLINSDVVIVEVSNSSSDINVINSQVHIGNEKFLIRKERENQRKYEEAIREIDLEKEIINMSPCDLKHAFRYENLGTLLTKKLYHSKDKVDNSEDNGFVLDPITGKAYAPDELLETVKSNLRYIDFDKLLISILQAEYDKYGEDIRRFSYEEALNLKKLSEKIENLLSRKNIEMSSDRFYDGVSFERLKAAIEELNSSYIAGEFYTEEELNYAVQDYINGQKDVQTLTPYEFKNVLRFTEGEIFSMLRANPSLLDYLIRNNIMEDDLEKNGKSANDRLFALIERQNKVTASQLQILYDSDKLTPEYLLQLYMDKNKVDIESIQALKENVDEQFFEGIVTTSELVNLYLAKDEEKERFDKYRKLYKKVVIEGKTREEKNEISTSILDQSIELLKEEHISELYSLGLVTIDTVIDYNGVNSLKELYLSNELKPIDAKRLFYEGIINEDMLKSIMLDSTIDEGKKITLLYSTFPEVEDTEIMRKLEACLREVTENNKSNSSSEKSRTEIKENQDTPADELKKIKKAYEPRAKYRLLSIIDNEYKFYYNIKDGTGIFYFPNRDEYLIEKLYSKGRKPATDVATYILSKDSFEQNQDRIIQDGRVNISELYELKKSNTAGVKRLVHTGWANSIVKYYELDNERKYSQRQIAETKRLAEQVEKSKREIER